MEDNGPGIPLDMQRRIFDPFFTTKPVGQGTGLGLSVCRRIVESLGGEITVASGGGGGAKFTVLLPAAPPLPRSPSQPPGKAGHRARVLVIDDELAVTNTIRRILSREHDVVAHDDPRRALALLESGAEFDVILCDLMMPHLTGRELFTSVIASRPDPRDRFVFMTGGVTSPKAREFLAGVTNETLDKPFAAVHLLNLAARAAESTRRRDEPPPTEPLE